MNKTITCGFLGLAATATVLAVTLLLDDAVRQLPTSGLISRGRF